MAVLVDHPQAVALVAEDLQSSVVEGIVVEVAGTQAEDSTLR